MIALMVRHAEHVRARLRALASVPTDVPRPCSSAIIVINIAAAGAVDRKLLYIE